VETLKTIWSNVKDNLWFVPTIFTVGGAVVALLVVRFNDDILDAAGVDPGDYWWLFGGGSDAARSILEVIAGSIITVTGVVFSVTIIALQLTSTQFTPRVLRTFTADRGNQLVLGVFIGTFVYTLLVQRAVRASDNGDGGFVPAVAITVAILAAIVSIGFLIYFIAHTARSIQVNIIVDNVTNDTRRVMQRLFEQERAAREAGEQPPRRAAAQRAVEPGPHGRQRSGSERRTGEPEPIGSAAAGYVQSIDEDSLVALADENRLFLQVEQGVGDFALPEQPLLLAWPRSAVDDRIRRRLRRAFYLGPERTPHQDLEIGMIELVDVAIKAMSPSINDPTTAITVLDRLAELLVLLGSQPPLDCERIDRAGRVCLIVRRPSFERALRMTYDQIRHHCADDPSVMVKLVKRLGEIGEIVLPTNRSPVLEVLDTAARHAERAIDEPADREKLARAAARARRRIAAADHDAPVAG
jgi:uncharacterized membrane protein